MQRGEVRLYPFDYPDKKRPVVVLTRDSALEVLTAVTVAPITTKVRAIQTHVLLTIDDGMKEDCAVSLDAIQTVAKKHLGPPITRLNGYKMAMIRRAANFALGFD